MKLLIACNSERKIHMDNFSEELTKFGIESKIIIDTDYLEKTLSLDLKSKRLKKYKQEKLLDTFSPDLILLDRISSLGEFFIKKQIPFLILLRGNYWEELMWTKKFNQGFNLKSISISKNEKMTKKIFSKSKGIIAISEYLKNEVKKRYPDKSVDVIYADGRKISDWVPTKNLNLNHPCVGLVQGFNIWGKTQELETLIPIMKEMPHVTFYLAGDGMFSEKIIRKLKNFENFVWLGNLQYPKQITNFYSSIDIFLFLSRLEGLGQSIIESMLMKKPVIATNVGGIPELIDNNENGFLVNPGDDKKIILTIQRLLSNPQISDDLVSNAFTKATKNFSWSIIAKNFAELLEKKYFFKIRANH
tara:strand:- start:1227 stop:2306 length:1080 start_codon:yes stop_codon:yes gene_type:complete